MPRQDDPALTGDIKVLRRIPPTGDRVEWDADGTPTPTSQNFRDNRTDELSLYIATETTPERVLHGLCGFGLVELTIREIREVYRNHNRDLVICRDEDADSGPGHILACGKPSPSMRDKLRTCAKWVDGYWPAKTEDVT